MSLPVVQSAERICSLLSLHHQQASLSACTSQRGGGIKNTNHSSNNYKHVFHSPPPPPPLPAACLLSAVDWSVWSPTEPSDPPTTCHPASRCNYAVPSIHLLFHLLLSAAAIAANFYLLISTAKPQAQRIQARWAPAPLSPHRREALIRLQDLQPLGRMTHNETNIYLLHKQTSCSQNQCSVLEKFSCSQTIGSD